MDTTIVRAGEIQRRPRRPWWNRNREIYGYKIHYFLMYAAYALVFSSGSGLLLKQIMISPSSLATILGINQFASFFAKPLIGLLTDYLNRIKAIILTLTLIEGLCFLGLLIVPSISKGIELHETIYPTEITTPNYESNMSFKTTESTSPNMSALFEETELFKKSKHPISERTTEIFFTTNESTSTNMSDFPEESEVFTGESLEREILRLHIPPVIIVHKEKKDPPTATQRIFGSSTNEIDTTAKESSSSYSMQQINKTTNKPYLYTTINSMSTTRQNVLSIDSKTPQYWIFAALFITMDLAGNTALTLTDTACYESIQKSGGNYGRQRLWGTVGWGIFASIGGLINHYTNNYYASATVFIALLFLMLLNISQMEMSKNFTTSIKKDVVKIMKSKEFMFFEFSVLISGVGYGVVFFNLIWFVTEFSGSILLCGLLNVIQIFGGELPFVFFSGYLEKRLGYSMILTLAFLAYFIRFVTYFIIRNIWLILVVEWLHGVSYGLFHTVMVSKAKKSATRGTEATIQTMVSATFKGLGAGIGSVIAGYGIGAIGFQDTFLYVGCFYAICTLISFMTTLSKLRKMGSTIDLHETSSEDIIFEATTEL